MQRSLLSEILQYCALEPVTGPVNIPVRGICYHSQKAGQDYIFIAITGVHTDGHKYIPQAIRGGANIIVSEQPLAGAQENITHIRVKNSRQALSSLAAAFYGFPANHLKLIGVTGTDGKSSTVWFLHQLLEKYGLACGFISTVEYKIAGKVESNPYRQSTPEALEINNILRQMVNHNKEIAVIETTSHGLSGKTGRLTDISFTAGILTNISHEHLEFHGTFEQYRYDKANLFRQLCQSKPGAFGVVNLNDENHNYFREAASCPVYSFSLGNSKADLYAEIISSTIDGTDFLIHYAGRQYPARLNIPGQFNIENLLAALLTIIKLLPVQIKTLLPFIPAVTAPRGRVTSINMGQNFNAIVDYAHTPRSFERFFSFIRPLTAKRIISVFGSAGERDVIKRAVQGKIAADFSDIIILTNEDPREEEPMKILEEIAAGCPNLIKNKTLFLIPDRTAAIRKAFCLAEEDDTVLLLGKGHESSIIHATGPQQWDEIEVCKKILQELLVEKKGLSA